MSEHDLYVTLEDWLDAVKKGDKNFRHPLRLQFGDLEVATFGSISDRAQNPLALRYDGVRNMVVLYLQTNNRQHLDEAEKRFRAIPKPKY